MDSKADKILKTSRIRAGAFKNIHRGERCFVLGTGPSLNYTNLDLIKDEIIFGVNALYKGFDKFNIKCKYYAVTHPGIRYFQEIMKPWTTVFISGCLGAEYIALSPIIPLPNPPIILPLNGYLFEDENAFALDITKGLANGWTVITDVCLQVCLYMGFDEVYLLGCDWDYETEGKHFCDGGAMCDPRFLERTKISYEVCKKWFEHFGKKIYNATPNSKLDVFEHVKLEDII